jgi:ferric-dicitrate binding protein FerR (iron transport regulator)
MRCGHRAESAQVKMMSDQQKSTDNDVIGELIRTAGRREKPSPAEYDRVFSAAAVALDDKLRRRRRRFTFSGIAAALGIFMIAGLISSILPTAPSQPIARVDRIAGSAEFFDAGSQNGQALLENGAALFAQTRVRTGPGSRVGLLMANGVSLRLAESTIVEFVGPTHIELVSGKVYADAGKDIAETPEVKRIVVETGTGTTWDLGTQFEVRYVEDRYRLRVREGHVYLQQPSRELRSSAGDQLSIDADQNLRREHIAKDDPDWQWTETVAPDPAIDSRPVTVLLDWVSRQTGRDIAYARPELEQKAEKTVLYGSVRFVKPLEALETMLATTDFDYTLLEDGTILIDTK